MPHDHAYHHGDLPAELVRIARELVRESGPSGCSMREVSRRAGVSQAARFRHFEDKTALLDAVGAGAYAELEQRYHEAIGKHDDPAGEARAVAHAYLRFAIDEPQLFRLIFSSPRLHKTREAVQSYQTFEGAIARSQQAGMLPAGPTAPLAHMLWSAMHGVADLVLSGSLGRRQGKALAERMLDALLRGLRAD